MWIRLMNVGNGDKDMNWKCPNGRGPKEGDMFSKCKRCGCSKAESIANAKRLGLVEELQNREYTCCQIAVWFHEQWLAWFDAANEDAKHDLEKMVRADYDRGRRYWYPGSTG